jgi:DNA-binding beta-propeller fold protein YncE
MNSARPLLLVSLIFTTIFVTLAGGVSATPGDLYVTNLATNTVDVYSPDGAKSIFASGLDGNQSFFVSDAGIPNSLAFETE